MSKIFVAVIGMHRSGTSAMSGLLHSNGVVMGRKGEFFPPPQMQNPKGFYENRRFREINDNLLREVNYNVKSFDPKIPVVYANHGKLRETMIDLIKEYSNEFDCWGWKDPRTCLTLYPWLDVIDELGLIKRFRVIIMNRPFTEIVKSMMRRNNKECRRDQFYDLVSEYYKRIIESFSSFHSIVCTELVEFYDLLYYTESVAKRLGLFLRRDISDLSFVDPEISKMSPQGRKDLLAAQGLTIGGKPRNAT
jgi:hypothetical protein